MLKLEDYIPVPGQAVKVSDQGEGVDRCEGNTTAVLRIIIIIVLSN